MKYLLLLALFISSSCLAEPICDIGGTLNHILVYKIASGWIVQGMYGMVYIADTAHSYCPCNQ